MDTQKVTEALVKHFGGEEALAAAVGTSQSSVNRWKAGGNIRGNHLLKLLDVARRIPEIAPMVSDVISPSVEAFKPEVVSGRDLVGARDFPIYAAAMGGDGHQIVTFEAIDYVKRPAILEHVRNAYGIYIVGDSMSPAFEPGDMALVNPQLPPARDRNVVLYHVPPEGGLEAEAIVKRLTGFNDRDWMLRQFNPASDFTEARVDWPICHRIVGKYEAR